MSEDFRGAVSLTQLSKFSFIICMLAAILFVLEVKVAGHWLCQCSVDSSVSQTKFWVDLHFLLILLFQQQYTLTVTITTKFSVAPRTILDGST